MLLLIKVLVNFDIGHSGCGLSPIAKISALGPLVFAMVHNVLDIAYRIRPMISCTGLVGMVLPIGWLSLEIICGFLAFDLWVLGRVGILSSLSIGGVVPRIVWVSIL
jgi:hypothetical protein